MTTPTIVLGIGQAGCRMVSDLNELVEKEGKQDYFRYITIDTNGADLDDESPERADITTIKLDKPTRYWTRDREQFFYLDESLQIEADEGTGQRRPVSRYHIDNGEHFRSHVDRIESAIEGFQQDIQKKEGADDSVFYVWVLNSLGGGTGSGAFPLIGTLLRDVLDSQQFIVNGIGSLPRVDNLMRERFDPSGQNQYYVNAYTALEELKSLVDYDDREDYEAPPVWVQSGGTTTDDYLQPRERFGSPDPTFNKYWLVGYKEEEPFQAYRKRMNRIASNAIFYFAHKDQPEDFPYHDSVEDETLMGISSVELTVPVERARSYVDNEELISELEEKRADLDDEIDVLGETINYLEAVESLSIHIDSEEPESNELISEDLISGAKDARTDAVDPSTDLTDVTVTNNNADRGEVGEVLDDILDTAVDSLNAYVRNPRELDTGKKEFDPTDVIEKFYCKILFETIEQDHLSSHDFKEEVDELWNDYDGKLKDEYPNRFDTLDNGGARERWVGALDEFLPEYKRQQEEIAEGTLRPIKKGLAQKRAKDAEQNYERAEALFENYERLRQLSKIAEERHQSAVDSLNDDISSLRDLRSRKRSEKRDTISNLHEREDQQETLRERLRKGQRQEGLYNPPMQNLGRLDYDDLYRSVSVQALIDDYITDEETVRREFAPETSEGEEVVDDDVSALDIRGLEVNVHELQERGILDETDLADITEEMVVSRPSISKLIEKEILDEGDVGNYMEALLQAEFLTTDPIQDITENPPVDVTPEAIIGFLMSEENTDAESPAGDLLKMKSDQGEFDIQDTLSAVGDGTIDDPSHISDGLSIKFITWFAPVALENTSEYGTMYRHYIEEDSDINEHLSTLTDEDVTRSFAYPELVEDEEVLERLAAIGRTPPNYRTSTRAVKEDDD